MSFFSQRSLEGWSIAYSSQQDTEVGVIDPDLLPANSLLYRYYFIINPQPVGGSGTAAALSFGSFLAGVGIGGDVISRNTDYVEYDLDFVVSKPIWNQLVKATSDNTDGNVLTLSQHVINVAYVFKVTLDSDGKIEYFYDAADANPKPPSDLPEHPGDNAGRQAWLDYYGQFDSWGTWGSYNRHQGTEGSPDQDYTYNHRPTGSQTNSKRIKVKNLTVGDYYIVSYEGVEEHLFRHHFRMNFDEYVFIILGVSVGPPAIPVRHETGHYLWKEWKDDDGTEHEGWRISESWKMDVKSHQLQDEDSVYDPVSNPVTGIESNVEWSLFNMVEKNLRLKDKERIGYNRNYAEYLSDQIPLSTVTAASAALVDTNNVTPSTVHRDNFKIEYVADNIVNYSGRAAAWAVIEQGGALGVLFRAPFGSYSGHTESAYYKRKLPKNTRIVSAYSRIRHGVNGRVIFVKMKKGADHVTVVEDPFFFMTINKKAYYHYFDDGVTDIKLTERRSSSASEVQYQYPDEAQILGATRQSKIGSTMSPGESIFFADNEDSARTFNDDTNLTSSTTNYSVPTSYSVFDTVVGTITDVTAEYPDKPAEAEKVFRVSVPEGSVIGAIKINLTPADPTDSSALLRLRGESGTQLRELSNVSLPTSGTTRVDVGAWEDIDYIFVMSDIDCTLDQCDAIVLSDTVERDFHLLGEVSSMAATTDSRGNFMLFSTDREGRVNVAMTGNGGHSWTKYESILMRGDEVSDLRGVPNQQEHQFFLFHFYKNALLCVPMDLTLFMIGSDSDKKVESLDTIRRQACYLVWGKAIKPASERETQTTVDSSGATIVTYEDLNDNVIFTDSDETIYQNAGRSVMRINSVGSSADTTTKSFTDGNKFIYIGKSTASNGLATSEPTGRDYSVYRSKRGAFRLFIDHEDSDGNRVFRNLTSWDNGLNWADSWRYEKDDPADKIVRINYLSDKEETEEGTNISLLYNESEDKAYIFYFYLGAVLCKAISDEVFDMKDWDEQADILNALPIYAVAGNLQAVVGESNYESLAPGDEKNIVFNAFQRDSSNLTKYYSEEYYNEQPISGYFTTYGYLRIFLVNSKNIVDAYFYDGAIWRPEKVVLE